MKAVMPPVNEAVFYKDGHLFTKYKTPKLAANCLLGKARKGDGYIQFKYAQKLHFSHRVIWELFNGPIKSGCEIDHIDGDKANNRIENLRLVSRQENAKNLKMQHRNRTGTSGVIFTQNKYRVTIGAEYLGYFDTLEEAIQVRKEAEKVRGYHINHGRKSSCNIMT